MFTAHKCDQRTFLSESILLETFIIILIQKLIFTSISGLSKSLRRLLIEFPKASCIADADNNSKIKIVSSIP